jgi:anti-sigma factor RsiW
MNQSEYNQLKEKSWQGKLTTAEQAELRAWLAEHPELADDWLLEANLTEAIQRLPDVPVPSNFTARVLQAVEREGATQSRPRLPAWKWFLHSLVPGTAMAAVLLGLGIFTYHEHRQAEQRAELVQGVKVVADVPSLPSPEVLQNFDTIRQMGTTPGPDPELIALLK